MGEVTNSEVRASLKSDRCPICTEQDFSLVTRDEEKDEKSNGSPRDIVRTLFCNECGYEVRVKFIFWEYLLDD